MPEAEDRLSVGEGAERIPRTISGFLLFVLKQIVRQRKWLLLPLWVILAVVGVLLLLSGGSSLLPVIYIAF